MLGFKFKPNTAWFYKRFQIQTKHSLVLQKIKKMKKQLLPTLLFLFVPFFLFSKNLKTENFASFAGTMDLTPVSVCQGGSTTPAHNNDEILEPGDVMVFVIHDNAGPLLGTVYSIQFGANPVFELNGNMSFNTTYYLSAIAGTDLGSGVIDLSDPELSVAIGTPVTFEESIPTVLDSTICLGDTVTVGGEFYTQTGNYNIVLTNTQGCDSVIDLTVTVIDNVIPVIVNGVINCFNNVVWASTNFTPPPGAAVTYLWTGPGIGSPSNEPQITVFTEGVYSVTATIQLGGETCIATNSAIVAENTVHPFADAGPDQILDCATGEATLQGTSFGGGCEELFWTSPNGFVGTGSSVVVTEPGTYVLEVFDFCNGCTNSDIVVVTGETNEVEIGDNITLSLIHI